MLQYVEIRDLAVVEHLKVDFDEGLNVITGETGAGKSIFIKALSLLAGAKADKDTVRSGAKAAYLSALFDCPKSLRAYLDEHEISTPEGQLVIKRVISAKGRSQAWLNEQLVSTEFLKTICEQMIDVFAQNQGIRILHEDVQRDCIDTFAGLDLSTYFSIYQKAKFLLDRILEIAQKHELLSRDKDYFEYRVKEFDSIEFSQSHYDSLLEKSLKLKQAAALKELNDQIMQILDQGFGSDLNRLIHLLKKDRTQSFESQIQKAEDIRTQLDDLSFSLQSLICDEEVEDEIHRIEEELSLYQRLFRKHGLTHIHELEGVFKTFKDKMEFLDHFDFQLASLTSEFNKAVQRCVHEALRISKKRQEKASDLVKQISKELRDMAIEDSKIHFNFSSMDTDPSIENVILKSNEAFMSDFNAFSALRSHGLDRIECMFSANKGDKLLPLVKVASGGELSRIMLAMKKVLSAGAESCLLVFDEIDTGISGKVASLVGKSLKGLSQRFQVICITHLAQVAAFADQHFKVEKIKLKDRVNSQIRLLNEKESTDELAQMISASAVTKESRAHAQKLKRQLSELP